MRAFDRMSANQLQGLALEVLRLRREGLRDAYVALLQGEGEETDEQDVAEVVDLRTRPGDRVPLPAIGPANLSAIARGREVYVQCGCRSCHGEDGTGTRTSPCSTTVNYRLRCGTWCMIRSRAGTNPSR